MLVGAADVAELPSTVLVATTLMVPVPVPDSLAAAGDALTRMTVLVTVMVVVEVSISATANWAAASRKMDGMIALAFILRATTSSRVGRVVVQEVNRNAINGGWKRRKM